MRVVLVRHGQPDFDTHRWISTHGVRLSLQQYRDSRVTAGPLNELFSAASVASYHFMTSGLPRAQDSSVFCQNIQAEVSELLNEAELPYPEKLWFPLPWSFMITIFRLGWLLGYRSNAQGISGDLERARQAAALLIDRAFEHTDVCVFGHGIMNRLIARELKKCGWKIQSKKNRGYWSKTVMFSTSE